MRKKCTISGIIVLLTVTTSLIACGGKTPLTQEQIDSINKVKADSIRVADSLVLIQKHINDSIKHVDDSIAKIRARETKITQINNLLKNTSVDYVSQIQTFYNAIDEIKDAISEEKDTSLKAKWTRELKAMQAKQFPKARKVWAQEAKEKMWEYDCEVNISGKTLTLTAGMFAANANIKTAYQNIADALHDLRFKRCNFKWYRYDDNYTYYTINSKNDTDL